MLRDVAWANADGSPLDYLIIDLPPGTGDVQLTLAQKVRATGAVIVSTPQDIALIDARRAVEMFQKTGVPILGLVENMSVHICSNCGHTEHIFGQGGAKEEAAKLGMPFLGEVPLAKSIREQSDNGTPIVLAQPESVYAKSYDDIVSALL
jgi:ATP-binding protein involved in chromosome partitioning